MATTTTPHTSLPEAPEQTPPRPSGRRTIVLGAAAVLAAGAATAALAVATLGTDTRNEPVGRPADEGPVENSAGRAPACEWTSEANGPVFPANDIGGPPTPESVLIFESCDGQLTGTIAWLNPGPATPTP